MSYYEVGGVTQLPGAATIGTATPVPAHSVSAPSMGYPNGSQNEVWFRLTATTTGDVLFDATLSLDLATQAPEGVGTLTLFSGGGSATTLGDLTFLASDTGFSVFWSVTAGTTYYIRISKSVSDFVTALILRVSDYAVPTDWVQAPDQQWVLATPESGVREGYDNYLPSPVDLGHTRQPNHLPEYPTGGTRGGYGLGGNQKWSAGYHSHFGLRQSFGGPHPGADSLAWDCMWPKARKGSWGTDTWSQYPRGEGGHDASSWNGTNPYDGGTATGTCEIITGTTGSVDASVSGAVSMSFHSDDPTILFSAKFADFQTEASCQRLNLTKTIHNAGQGAGIASPTPPSGLEDAGFEWENSECTMIGLDAAADEYMTVDRAEDPSNSSPSTFAIDWHIAATAADENPSQTWGPDRANSQWVGDTSGPSVLGSDLHLPPYTGGLADWVAVGTGAILDALTYEAAGADAGIRAVGISDLYFTSDTIPALIQPIGVPEEDLVAYRINQVVSFRAHLRPSRYRWLPVPVLPDVTPLVSTITGEPIEQRDRFIG